jgi:hypothetical protein
MIHIMNQASNISFTHDSYHELSYSYHPKKGEKKEQRESEREDPSPRLGEEQKTKGGH